jgi:hypothetical protein
VNVSFGGNNPQQQQQQQQFGLSASNGLQNSFHSFGQLERMQQQTGTSSKFFVLFISQPKTNVAGSVGGSIPF